MLLRNFSLLVLPLLISACQKPTGPPAELPAAPTTLTIRANIDAIATKS